MLVATMPEKIKFYLGIVKSTAIHAREFLTVMVVRVNSAATMSKLTRFTFRNIHSILPPF